MREYRKFLELLRRHSNEVENDLIDELLAGRVGRREFLRHGTVLGMSAPALAAIAGAGVSLGASPARAAAGGTIRIAQPTPSGAIDPVTVPDSGGVIMLCQTGEYLCLSAGDLRLRPVLAESWKPNQDGSVWLGAGRAESQWPKNLLASGRCRVRIGRDELAYTAVELDGARRAGAVAAIHAKYGGRASRVGTGPVFELRPLAADEAAA